MKDLLLILVLIVGIGGAVVSMILLIESGAADHAGAFTAYLIACAILIAGGTVAWVIDHHLTRQNTLSERSGDSRA